MDNNKIKRISFYDLDSTLIKSIEPDEGIKKWEILNNKKYPNPKYFWWEDEFSLDYNIFNIKPYKKILKILNDDNENNNTLTVLLTARKEKLKPIILKLLNHLNITLDYYTFKTGDENKVDRINSFIKKYSNLEVINIYDDREKEIKGFKKFKNENSSNIVINIHKISSGEDRVVENKINRIIIDEIFNNYKYL